jgi:hypothetical protein
MDASLVISILLGIVAVLVAIFVPITIEKSRRPIFSIKVGEGASVDDSRGRWKYLHIVVVNAPLVGKRGSWLLRETATGCKASLTFEELGMGRRPAQHIPARWSSLPEPTDPRQFPASYRFDLTPDTDGEPIGVAIKHEGLKSAWAFSANSYLGGGPRPFCYPGYELPGQEYRLTVNVAAGGVEAAADFRLRNYGTTRKEFTLEPWS